MSSEQGWGVFIVNENRWRRATCDAFDDSAVVYRHKADAEAEANTMEQMGFGECVARPFDWSEENENKEPT